ncbi:MAG: phosphoglycerate dehydrogenase [Deltaproteobacteria bacterium]|nr:phosphoglycerate dehydrogenase [Deltaproteobacteria bacterium]MBW2122882.1 phosphoglycerate dehydrogenase [Deltaproteobacteria bacterium]
MRVLITTTSFLDTPGSHHELLEEQGYEIVTARGPLGEEEMIRLVGDVDGLICGDDAISKRVVQKAVPRLRVISKYGIGLDRIDLEAARRSGVPVTYTPGVNEVTVAEHTFGLMISLARNIPQESQYVKRGEWKRITGHELWNKTLGIIGMGRIGKEVAKRALAFEMKILGCDPVWNESFAEQYSVARCVAVEDLLKESDFVTLHMNLTPENRHFINRERLALMKETAYLVNCARGALVDAASVVEALKNGKIAGYGTDVLEHEPPGPDDPLVKSGLENVILTPHIGSRTYESVVRQATMAVKNLVAVLQGESPLAQAN